LFGRIFLKVTVKTFEKEIKDYCDGLKAVEKELSDLGSQYKKEKEHAGQINIRKRKSMPAKFRQRLIV